MTEFDLGRPVPFHVARDPVNLPVMRRWCDTMDDRNPVHTDPDFAARSRFGRIVAPLAMLDVWTKPGLAYERDPSDPQGAAFEILDRDGFTSAVAVTSELTQERPLVLGDDLRSTVTLEAVSSEKSTALGEGHFVTTRHDFFRATSRSAVPASRSSSSAPPVTGDSRPPRRRRAAHDGTRPPPRVRRARHARDVRSEFSAGRRTRTPRSIPVTTTLVVSGTLMTSDYFDAHHDRDAARRRGRGTSS